MKMVDKEGAFWDEILEAFDNEPRSILELLLLIAEDHDASSIGI